MGGLCAGQIYAAGDDFDLLLSAFLYILGIYIILRLCLPGRLVLRNLRNSDFSFISILKLKCSLFVEVLH